MKVLQGYNNPGMYVRPNGLNTRYVSYNHDMRVNLVCFVSTSHSGSWAIHK